VSAIDIHLAWFPAKPTVEARLRRMNPNLDEFGIVRGRFRKPMSWRRAKAKWQRGIPDWRPFMEPGGRRIVNPRMERCTPGDFLPGGRAAR